MIDLKGRVALVTGAAQGIGAAIVQQMVELGAFVAAVDVRPGSFKESHFGSLAQWKGYEGDILDRNFLGGVVSDLLSQRGRIDILVNNAGIIRDQFLTKLTEEDWDRVIEVNLKGPFLCCQAVVPKMREQKSGKIVNMISRSWLGNIGQSNYAASKGGLVSLTRTLALELARDGIQVNGVAPGPIDTPMTRGMPEKARERLIQMQPGGRIGKPEDISAAVTFLCSDRADFITGQILHVDGGKSCGILSL